MKIVGVAKREIPILYLKKVFFCCYVNVCMQFCYFVPTFVNLDVQLLRLCGVARVESDALKIFTCEHFEK